jgi:hypothetical protein
MIDAESISLFFGTAASIWVLGFAWGKSVAWLRELKNAA